MTWWTMLKAKMTGTEKSKAEWRKAEEARMRRELHEASSRVHFLEIAAELQRHGALPRKKTEE